MSTGKWQLTKEKYKRKECDIMKIRVAIPVHDMNKDMCTFDLLRKSNTKLKILVFCDEGQKEHMEHVLRGIEKFKVIECKGKPTRSTKRQIIMDYMVANEIDYFVSLDDDVVCLFQRDNLKQLTNINVRNNLYFDSVVKAMLCLLKDGAGVASVCTSFAHLVGENKNNVEFMKRPAQFCMYDMNKIKKFLDVIRYRDVQLEDGLFWFELMNKGILFATLRNVQCHNRFVDVVDKSVLQKERELKTYVDILDRQAKDAGVDVDIKEVQRMARRYKPKTARNDRAYDALKIIAKEQS